MLFWRIIKRLIWDTMTDAFKLFIIWNLTSKKCHYLIHLFLPLRYSDLYQRLYFLHLCPTKSFKCFLKELNRHYLYFFFLETCEYPCLCRVLTFDLFYHWFFILLELSYVILGFHFHFFFQYIKHILKKNSVLPNSWKD